MYANMRNFREWTMWQPASGASQLRNYEYWCAFVVCFLFSSSRNKWVCVFFHFIICSFIFKLVLSLSISSVYTILRSPPEQRNEKKNEMKWLKQKPNQPSSKTNMERQKEKTPLHHSHTHTKCENAARAIIFTLGVYCSRFFSFFPSHIYAPLMSTASMFNTLFYMLSDWNNPKKTRSQ